MNVVRRAQAEMNIKNASVFRTFALFKTCLSACRVSLQTARAKIHTAREESALRGLMLLGETSPFTIRFHL